MALALALALDFIFLKSNATFLVVMEVFVGKCSILVSIFSSWYKLVQKI